MEKGQWLFCVLIGCSSTSAGRNNRIEEEEIPQRFRNQKIKRKKWIYWLKKGWPPSKLGWFTRETPNPWGFKQIVIPDISKSVGFPREIFFSHFFENEKAGVRAPHIFTKIQSGHLKPKDDCQPMKLVSSIKELNLTLSGFSGCWNTEFLANMRHINMSCKIIQMSLSRGVHVFFVSIYHSLPDPKKEKSSSPWRNARGKFYSMRRMRKRSQQSQPKRVA